MSSGFLEIALRLAVAPGDLLVVSGMVGEASVEDANEPVAEGTQGLVVAVTGRPSLVVVDAGPR